jgi:minor extracellular protease Epr
MNSLVPLRVFRAWSLATCLLIWLALQGLQASGTLPSHAPLGLGSVWAQDDGDDGDDGDDDGDDGGGAARPGGGGSRGQATSRAPGPAASPTAGGTDAGGAGAGRAGAGGTGDTRGSGGRAFQLPPGAATAPPRAEPDGFLASELLATNPSPAALRRVQAWGARVIESVEHASLGLRTVRLRLPPGLDARTAAEIASERDPGVFELHRLYRLEQGGALAGCQGAACEAAQRLGWPAAGERCGADQVVGMVDTEVQAGHPSLRGARLNSRRFLLPGQTPADAAHGTAVAAILAGQADGGFAGLIPRARVLAAAPFYLLPSGGTATDAAALVRSLDWLVAQGARVIGLSLSGPPSVALQTAVAQAQRRGVLLAAAAGNGGRKDEPVYPAALEGVLGVTALGQGNRVYWRANQGVHVDYALPGVDIATPEPSGELRPRSGTSFAVPFLVAQVSQSVAEQRLSPGQWLSGQGVPVADLGETGRDPVFGWGLPQVPLACR